MSFFKNFPLCKSNTIYNGGFIRHRTLFLVEPTPRELTYNSPLRKDPSPGTSVLDFQSFSVFGLLDTFVEVPYLKCAFLKLSSLVNSMSSSVFRLYLSRTSHFSPSTSSSLPTLFTGTCGRSGQLANVKRDVRDCGTRSPLL